MLIGFNCIGNPLEKQPLESEIPQNHVKLTHFSLNSEIRFKKMKMG